MPKVIDGTLEVLDVADLSPHPKNPNQGDVGGITTSIEELDFYQVVIVQKSRRRILAGHARWRAAQETGIDKLPCWVIDVDDKRALRILHADNRWAELADIDRTQLLANLEAMARNGGLAGTGYDGDDLDHLLAELEAERDDRDKSTLLSRADVAIGDPKADVQAGDHFGLGHHVLVVADVMDGWEEWVTYLDDPAKLFCPYPGPYLPLSESAQHRPLVMVQPDRYIAAHIIDKWVAVKGEAEVTMRPR